MESFLKRIFSQFTKVLYSCLQTAAQSLSYLYAGRAIAGLG